MHLDGTGIWSAQLRYGDPGEIRDAAAELESLGYSALWIPGGIGGAIFDDCENVLAATEHVPVATGILNLWMHSPRETAEGHARLVAAHPDRFLLGIGVSHSALVNRGGAERYAKPLAAMSAFLDGIDTTDPPVPIGERVLAALGPKMLELSRDRAAGAHPYLANPDHTGFAREILGDGALLAPEQPAVLETDPATARAIARQHLAIYLDLPNYVNNLKRLGFADDDVANGGSDHLVDGVVAWGDEIAIAARVQAHRDAGADHVCLQLVTSGGLMGPAPLVEWRALASALFG